MPHSPKPIQILRDALLLFAGVIAANYFAHRSDFGWMELNPTPWLLPPLLIGARYGFVPGLAAGAFGVATIASVATGWQTKAALDLLGDHPYFFLSIVLTGALFGEIRDQLGRSSRHAQRDRDIFRERNADLESHLHVTLESKHELERRLASFNAPVGALDDELRALFAQPREEFQTALLRLLHRTSGITSAATYQVKDAHLIRIAAIDPTRPLGEKLELDRTPLVRGALESQRIHYVADIESLTSAQPFIAALPFFDLDAHQCVLLVQDLPPEAFDKQNLARLELSLSWVSAVAVMRQAITTASGNGAGISREDFRMLLEQAAHADRIHALPGFTLRITSSDSPAMTRAREALPSTAIYTMDDKDGGLNVLLPFFGMQETDTLTKRLKAAGPELKITAAPVTQGTDTAAWLSNGKS